MAAGTGSDTARRLRTLGAVTISANFNTVAYAHGYYARSSGWERSKRHLLLAFRIDLYAKLKLALKVDAENLGLVIV